MSVEEQNELFGKKSTLYKIFFLYCFHLLTINYTNCCRFSDQLQKLYQEENADLETTEVTRFWSYNVELY